jgi:hypothetical protein
VFKPARTVTVNLLVFLHFFVLPMVLQIPLVKINRFVSLGSLEETKATLVGATPLGSLRRAKSEYAESEFKLLAHKNGLALSAKHLWAFLPMGLAWGGYSLLWIFFIRCNASPGEGFNALLTIAHNLVLTLLLLITTVRALRGLQDVFSLRFELLALCNCTFLLLLRSSVSSHGYCGLSRTSPSSGTQRTTPQHWRASRRWRYARFRCLSSPCLAHHHSRSQAGWRPRS